MNSAKHLSRILLLTAAGWLGLATAQGAAPSAQIMMLTGKGTAASASGSIRALEKGQPVYAGEVVSTGVNSYMNLHFKDGSYILLRPSSRFQIEQFKYDGEPVTPKPEPAPGAKAETPKLAESAARTPAAAPAGSRAFFRLLRGGFRAVSGLVGKGDPNEYRVSSPVATIGIRGTDFETFLCDAACLQDPIIRDALGKASAGQTDPKLMHAAAIRAQYLRARPVKVQGGDEGNLSQVTYTHEGQVNQAPTTGGPPTPIPQGTGAVTTPNGNTGTFSQKPSSVNAPDPNSPSCN